MIITMEDFFHGFVRNYHSFDITPTSNNTKWTNKILGFYDQLGTLLGARVDYERKRYDLCWFWKDSDKEPWLHIEHENEGSWEKLKDTIRKIDDSVCEDIIVVVYPESEDLWTKFIEELEKSQKDWTKDTEVLAILDATIFQTSLIQIDAHIFSKMSGNSKIQAVKKTDETGSYYAILR